MSWLEPLRAALDACPSPKPVFFRDDDAGWGDDRLHSMLDRFDAHGLPVDLAVIPAELTPALAASLRARALTQPLRLHQHGWAHVNLESTGRKSELGPSRAPGAMVGDLAQGRERLKEAFGEQLDEVFTPPWNRCVPGTAEVLRLLGLRVLSRDSTAGIIGTPGLAEVPVTVDWFGHRKGVRWTRARLGEALAESVRRDGAVGVMLHHAVTDEEELSDVDALLDVVATHPSAMPATISEVARETALQAPPSRWTKKRSTY